MDCIKVNNITKKFGKTCALDDVSLEFKKNKIYGLLGRNGAGKSTLLNIISNRIFSDQGEVLINGESSLENDNVLQKVYYMSEKTYYPETMKIVDVIKSTKLFYPDFDEEYAEYIAEQFELNLKKKVKELSTGYNSIFKIMIALSVNTPYLLLDEPVLGLDANHRELFYKLIIEKYSEYPSNIIISTHLIEEISGIIEEVIIINKGKILQSESREDLMKRGYSITGRIESVDHFTKNKNVIGEDLLGGIKCSYILGNLNEEIPDDLDIGKLDLQKLFIQLTK